MTRPSDMDVSHDGFMARDLLPSEQDTWCAAGIEVVKGNLYGTAYPKDLISLLAGRAENADTQACQSEEIAQLRLDMHWHESMLRALAYFPNWQKTAF
ncbi:MAG: hypothetical protein ACK587_14540 [Cyanobacteriota bacterium]